MSGGTAGPAKQSLAGMHVVVTRPTRQAEPFCTLLQGAGAQVTRFPVIEIRGPRDPLKLDRLLDGLAGFDVAVFVSVNAVQQVLPRLRSRGGWPGSVQIAAIGARTARELEAADAPPGIVPTARFDSESLLEEPGLQAMHGRRVVIFRGDGGRDYLAETLAARGAEVVYAEAYRRTVPDLDPAPLLHAWATGGIDAVTVTSGESLHNLCRMVGEAGRAALLATPLVVGAGRVAALAREQGFTGPIETAADPTDAAMLEGVLQLRRRS